jgi:hypothetical protein
MSSQFSYRVLRKGKEKTQKNRIEINKNHSFLYLTTPLEFTSTLLPILLIIR